MYSAEVVAHTRTIHKQELISLVITFPRYILAELNTHRMLSKNSASSRAIPFKKMLKVVETNPFVPFAWQKDHSGMQGTEYFTNILQIASCESHWLFARDNAIKTAKHLNANSVTKQLCNRLLEPFMWHKVLITGNINDSGWINFFNQRLPRYIVGDKTYNSRKEAIKNNPEFANWSMVDWQIVNKGAAELHMMLLAEHIYDAVMESKPRLIKPGEWHVCFWDKIIEKSENPLTLTEILNISDGMCARTSYTLIDDEDNAMTLDKYRNITEKLLSSNPKHWSPFEHNNRAMYEGEWQTSINTSHARYDNLGDMIEGSEKGWCRNIRGYIQRRHILSA